MDSNTDWSWEQDKEISAIFFLWSLTALLATYLACCLISSREEVRHLKEAAGTMAPADREITPEVPCACQPAAR